MLDFGGCGYVQSDDEGILASEGVHERVIVVVVDFENGYVGGKDGVAARASEGCDGMFAGG